jgi:hypothetical protein
MLRTFLGTLWELGQSKLVIKKSNNLPFPPTSLNEKKIVVGSLHLPSRISMPTYVL